MIKKLCSYPGCHKVVEAGVKYCDKHRETDRKKYREYKQRRMRDEQEARRQQFYNSKAWEQFRAAQAAAQLGIDIYEYYTTGRIIDAENYHHIQEITEAYSMLVGDNGYEQQRPEVSIANKAQTELRAWAKELGLTPAARQRMKEAGNASESGIDPELDGMVAHD